MTPKPQPPKTAYYLLDPARLPARLQAAVALPKLELRPEIFVQAA